MKQATVCIYLIITYKVSRKPNRSLVICCSRYFWWFLVSNFLTSCTILFWLKKSISTKSNGRSWSLLSNRLGTKQNPFHWKHHRVAHSFAQQTKKLPFSWTGANIRYNKIQQQQHSSPENVLLHLNGWSLRGEICKPLKSPGPSHLHIITQTRNVFLEDEFMRSYMFCCNSCAVCSFWSTCSSKTKDLNKYSFWESLYGAGTKPIPNLGGNYIVLRGQQTVSINSPFPPERICYFPHVTTSLQTPIYMKFGSLCTCNSINLISKFHKPHLVWLQAKSDQWPQIRWLKLVKHVSRQYPEASGWCSETLRVQEDV